MRSEHVNGNGSMILGSPIDNLLTTYSCYNLTNFRWYHTIGAKSRDLRHFCHFAYGNADKLGASELASQTSGFLDVFDRPDDANSIDS